MKEIDPALEEARRRREASAAIQLQKEHDAFWSVRHQNPHKRRIKGIRRGLAYVRTRTVNDGTQVVDGVIVPRLRTVVASRRDGLSGRQWRRLRKDLNREAKRRAETPPQDLTSTLPEA